MNFKSICLIALVAKAQQDAPCYVPSDIVLLQDTTGSFHEDLPNVSAQLKGIMEAAIQVDPGTRFAVSDFRDKPWGNMGNSDDYCYKLVSELSENPDAVTAAYESLWASGGIDLPEAQLQAMIQLVNDPMAKWRQVVSLPIPYILGRDIDVDKECGAKVILLSTDATPHDPDDYILYNGVYAGPVKNNPPPEYMAPFPTTGLGSMSNIDYDDLCKNNEYPTVDTFVQEMTANNVTVVVMTPDDDPAVPARWREIITQLGEPEDYVVIMKNDSSNIANVIGEILQKAAAVPCPSTSTDFADLTTIGVSTLGETSSLEFDTTATDTTTSIFSSIAAISTEKTVAETSLLKTVSPASDVSETQNTDKNGEPKSSVLSSAAASQPDLNSLTTEAIEKSTLRSKPTATATGEENRSESNFSFVTQGLPLGSAEVPTKGATSATAGETTEPTVESTSRSVTAAIGTTPEILQTSDDAESTKVLEKTYIRLSLHTYPTHTRQDTQLSPTSTGEENRSLLNFSVATQGLPLESAEAPTQIATSAIAGATLPECRKPTTTEDECHRADDIIRVNEEVYVRVGLEDLKKVIN